MRSNKAIAVSGCLLHQSLMASGCEAAPAVIKPVVEWAMENEIGLVPWTCPETMYAGLPRKTKGIEGYRRDGLIDTSRIIAAPFAEYLHSQINGGIQIIAIVGVSFSPACSARRQAYHANEPGLFVQALTSAMSQHGLAVPVVDIDRANETHTRQTLDRLLHAEQDLLAAG